MSVAFGCLAANRLELREIRIRQNVRRYCKTVSLYSLPKVHAEKATAAHQAFSNLPQPDGQGLAALVSSSGAGKPVAITFAILLQLQRAIGSRDDNTGSFATSHNCKASGSSPFGLYGPGLKITKCWA